MTRVLGLALSVVFVVSFACKKESASAPKSKEAPVTAGKVENGVRRIEVEAGKDGYVPSKIAGKPGEKIVLVFKRTVDGMCMAQLRTPEGKTIELPKNQTVDVAVTVPSDGEVGFACGMDMYKGVVVAQPASAPKPG